MNMKELVLAVIFAQEIYSVCKFPAEWTGSWFLSGHRTRFNISQNEFGSYGSCLQTQSDTFIVQHEIEQCPRCVQIRQVHPGVLEFQASLCMFQTVIQEDLVCQLTAELPVHTLIRLDGMETACPVSGPLDFTYQVQGGRQCSDTPSEVSQCVAESQLMFSFQSCPHDYNTFSRDEILTCRAVWQHDSGHTFLLATWEHRHSDEDRIRCFLLETVSSGYLMSQSASPSCQGLTTSTGYYLYNLTKPSHSSLCSYPSWLLAPGRYHSLDNSVTHQFSPTGLEVEIRELSATGKPGGLVSKKYCVEIVNETNKFVKLVTRTIVNCESLYTCSSYIKRSENIVQVEEGQPTLVRLAACADSNFQQNSYHHHQSLHTRRRTYQKVNSHVTLVSYNPTLQTCPYLGVHNLSSLYIEGDSSMCNQFWFHQLALACNRGDQIEFHRECLDNPNVSAYTCLAAWTLPVSERPEDRRNQTFGYIIAQPEHQLTQGLPKRACFMYTQVGNNSFSWSAGKSECPRDIIPGIQGSYRFNTTRVADCIPSAASSAQECRVQCSVMTTCLYCSLAIVLLVDSLLHR